MLSSRYMMNEQGITFRFPKRAEITPQRPDRFLGQSSQGVQGTGGSIPEGKTSLANHSTSLYSPLLLWGSRDSVTGTATGLAAEQAGVRISSPKCGTYPASYSMRREANHSPPSSAEMKNECSYTSIPPYASLTQTETSYGNGVATLFRVVQILSHTF